MSLFAPELTHEAIDFIIFILLIQTSLGNFKWYDHRKKSYVSILIIFDFLNCSLPISILIVLLLWLFLQLYSDLDFDILFTCIWIAIELCSSYISSFAHQDNILFDKKRIRKFGGNISKIVVTLVVTLVKYK